MDVVAIVYIYCMLMREIWKCIHPRVSYSLRATPEGNMIFVGEYIFIFPEPACYQCFIIRNETKKTHTCKILLANIGTLSQTFKNHIHNNKEIQDQYPRENKVLFIGWWIVICAIHRWIVLFRQIEWNYGNGMFIAIKFI